MRSSLVALTLLLTSLGVAAGAGCTASSSDTPGSPDGGAPETGTDGSADAGSCATTGTGSLAVTVDGLPQGVSSLVTVSKGTEKGDTVLATRKLSLPAGLYTITAERVAKADPVVRAAYEPSLEGVEGGGSVCVRDGQTTDVTARYALIASSNKIWTGNATGGTASLLGYAPAAIAATGTPAATVAAETHGSGGYAFDSAGNVWVVGGTTTDPPLARYAAGTLGTTGDKTPDIEITSPAFDGGLPGPVAAAFDRSGNLWVSVAFAKKVVKLSAAQIRATGSPTPEVELTNIDGPSGLAFDASGNLWVAARGESRFYRYDAGHLGANAAAPDLQIEVQSPPPVTGTLPPPIGLAFDAAGNLWGNCDGVLARLTPTELSGAGSKTLTPAVQISLSVTALAEGIAFDEGGGLWLASSAGNFIRLAPSQLTTSGSKTPEIVITSPDVGYAQWFALYPAPAALPLYHRLP